MKTEIVPLSPMHKADLIRLCNTIDRKYLSGRMPYPYTEADADRWLTETARKEGTEWLSRIILADGRAVGSISLERRNGISCRDAEIGYYLDTAFRSQGIMTQAVQQLCNEAFDRWDILRISGRVHAENTASRRVLEKNGFVQEGILRRAFWKDGEIGDICLYGLLRQ